jgi:hypothetical protein
MQKSLIAAVLTALTVHGVAFSQTVHNLLVRIESAPEGERAAISEA